MECHADKPSSRAHLLAPIFSRLNNTLLLLLALACPCLAAPAPAVPWDTNAQGGFVMALTGDRRGNVWVGTEDRSLWRFSPSEPAGKQWTQFTDGDAPGLGDGVYSLTCDRLGRVWAGTGRSGVAVFTGKTWRTYGPMDGPLGCHVVALATSPVSGDVWGCTENGLFSYSLSHNTWAYFTRADGLPSDQPDCLAFARDGSLYVGTECDGLAIASPTDNYARWRHIPGPATIPDAPGGKGLPSSLINCLLVARDGTVYAGTDAGLAHSTDNGKTWRFLRGADWKDRLSGLETPVPPRNVSTNGLLLSEDYITALAEDGSGRLYIGHRQKGIGVYDEATALGMTPPGAFGGYVKALLPTSHGHLLIGSYGDGLQTADWPAPPAVAASRPPAAFPPLPAPAPPPTLAQMRAMLARLARIPTTSPPAQPVVTALDPDWTTQGTWVDRYGDFNAVMCNMNGAGNDQVRGYLAAWADSRGWMGRNAGGDDFLRYYMTWPHTDDPRCLQNMLYGGRTQAEYDDHGEEKATSLDGPDVYCTLRVPKGRYVLSVYDANKDGHGGDNRDRDYLATVKVTPMTTEQFLALGSPLGTPGREQEALFDAAPGGATARIHDFWGGVWQRFYVDLTADGANYVTVRVARNGSFNTILCGVFLDRAEEPLIAHRPPAAPAPDPPFAPGAFHNNLALASGVSVALMEKLLSLRRENPEWYDRYSRPYLLSVLRYLFDSPNPRDCMAEAIGDYSAYLSYRHDLALCFNDVHFFHQRDLVSPDFRDYQSLLWDKMTAALATDAPNIKQYIGHVYFTDTQLAAAFKSSVAERLYPALAKENQ